MHPTSRHSPLLCAHALHTDAQNAQTKPAQNSAREVLGRGAGTEGPDAAADLADDFECPWKSQTSDLWV